MDPETEKPKSSLPRPNIPPPNLAPPPPAPPSPLDHPATPPPPPKPDAGTTKVQLHLPESAPKNTETPGDDEDQPVPLNTRLIAFAIDAVLAIGIAIPIVWILPGFAEGLGWLVGTAYLVTRDALPFLEGQSVGKKAMKLKAVTLDGASLAGKWEPGLIRNAVLAIPFFALIELYVLMTREDKPERGRRLGDEWAKTKVIAVEEPSPEA